ncbi:hypothetical protein BKG69_15925 [Mycobacteroides chelonae]|uniref:acyltransferase domain-containing protein n=1 Tax=Mycobacteroides chelonae TaxID=1774 RepID=UPI0008A99571|nr:acyltransferase domain-containing protein [Mycobacteroides chelonae]OHT78133.1 hypothetical protein BKG69_15925 [Mycobacteroides chelonae]
MTYSSLIQFPGLGGYAPGALAELVADTPSSAAILSDLDDIAKSYDLKPISGPLTSADGPTLEDFASPPTSVHLASFASSYLLYAALVAKGVDGDILLGQSTGELTALVAAGCLSVTDAAKVLCDREVALSQSAVSGGLTALSVGTRRAGHFCGAAGGHSLMVSLSNSPQQSVVSGTEGDLLGVEAIAQALGVQATRLPVHFAHHNPLLATAAQYVAQAAASYDFADPVKPTYSPILGHLVHSAADARRIVERHLTGPVDYLSALRTLYDEFEVREIIEVGARSVLTELARETLPASVTLIGPPPAARGSRQILDALVGSADSAPTAPSALRPPEKVFTATVTTQRVPVRPALAVQTIIAPTSTLPEAGALVAQLRRTFADAVGYPEDVFTDDAHLEADLGIASVKKTELLVRLLDEYSLPTPPASVRLRDYNTLPKLAGLMQTLADGGALR